MGGDARELRVLVVGAGGRMGAWAVRLLRDTPGFRVVAEVGGGDDLAAVAGECGAAVGLELTVAGLGARHARTLLEAGVRPVVGTSGVTSEEVEQLDLLARERGLGGLVVPNFCLGVALLNRAAVEAARVLPSVEIVETHHPEKRDAPSGTALDTARRIAAARPDENDPGYDSANEPDDDSEDERGPEPAPPARGHARAGVPIHSLRLPGVLARHEVHFGAPGERLVLTHEATDRRAFGPGLLLALRHALTAKGVACGLEAALPRHGR